MPFAFTLNLHLSRPNLERERNFCLQSARSAARICLAAPRVQAQTKSDFSPVTAADFAIQAAIAQQLHAQFPDDPLVAEEDLTTLNDDKSLQHAVHHLLSHAPVSTRAVGAAPRVDPPTRRCWTLDPIDGTRGFLSGGGYAVGLALMQDENVMLSALALPRDGRVLLAGPRGLEQHGPHGQVDEARANTSVWLLSGASDLALARRPAWTALCCGSLVKYAAVATGRAQGFVHMLRDGESAAVWDHAAGIGAVQASGGRVTDVSGGRVRVRADGVFARGGVIVVTPGGADHARFCAEVGSALRWNRWHA